MISFQSQLGCVYLFSFVSYYLQWPGLYGYNGILPIQDLIEAIESQHDIWFFWKVPTIVMASSKLEVSPDCLAEVVLLIGIIVSLLTVYGLVISYRINFLILWICYLSIIIVGQTFSSFQWDILILEVGFLSIFAGSANRYLSHLNWCYRFLAFKLMFLSGVVKLQALCPIWESLTALEYHFATQCIPTPLAWFANQLPVFVLRLAVAMTLLIEIPLSVLLVAPFRGLRCLGAALQMILQISILLTGNYNFFNLLTLVLMGKVWTDDWGSFERGVLVEESKFMVWLQSMKVSVVSFTIQIFLSIVFIAVSWKTFFKTSLDLSGSFSAFLSNSTISLISNLQSLQNGIQQASHLALGKNYRRF